jgi:hypothetical protein
MSATASSATGKRPEKPSFQALSTAELQQVYTSLRTYEQVILKPVSLTSDARVIRA